MEIAQFVDPSNASIDSFPKSAGSLLSSEYKRGYCKLTCMALDEALLLQPLIVLTYIRNDFYLTIPLSGGPSYGSQRDLDLLPHW